MATQLKEIEIKNLKINEFIEERIKEIKDTVKDGTAINALSGGVDSSAVTILGHRALGSKLKTYFIDNGIMRENEPQYVVSVFKKLGVPVELIDYRKEFFSALKGICLLISAS